MIQLKLSGMMFVQYFVWGAWYVTLGTYLGTTLGFDGSQIGLVYGTTAVAAMISPFFVGMIADRYFASERVLAALHLLGAIPMAAAPMLSDRPVWFIVALGLHMLCYMPTIALTNTICFAHLTNQEKQFPLVRVFGTFGWIAAAAGVVSLLLKADTTAGQYYTAAVAGVVLAVFSLSLPHTAPPAKGKAASAREIVGLDALAMLKRRSYLVFIVSAFLISIPLATYYSFANAFVGAAGVERIGAVMSVGQVAEVLFMFLIPVFFARLGVKWMLAMGMLGWVARYALFALSAPEQTISLIVIAIALHGICYDFFFVTGFIYTEKKSRPEIRGQAQGFLVLMTYGLGMLIGSLASGYLQADIVSDGTMAQWAKFWWIPSVFAGAVLLFFLALFHDDVKEPADAVAADMQPAPQGAQAGIGH